MHRVYGVVHGCSRFYETDSAIKIGMMEAFKKLAVDPDSLPDIIFASIGRTTWKVGGPHLTALPGAQTQPQAGAGAKQQQGVIHVSC